MAQAESDEGRAVERWFFAKWLRQASLRPRRPREEAASAEDAGKQSQSPSEAQAAAAPSPTTASDGAQQPSLAELFAPATRRGNPTPRFFSGDNPVLVAVGALAALGVLASAARAESAVVDGAVLACGLAFGLSRLGLK